MSFMDDEGFNCYDDTDLDYRDGPRWEWRRQKSSFKHDPLHYHHLLFPCGEAFLQLHETQKAILFAVKQGSFWVPKALLRKSTGDWFVHTCFERSYLKSEVHNLPEPEPKPPVKKQRGNCSICTNFPLCSPRPPETKPHRHRWALLTGYPATKRHCFLCNTTQRLASATRWVLCETALFGIPPEKLGCTDPIVKPKGTP